MGLFHCFARHLFVLYIYMYGIVYIYVYCYVQYHIYNHIPDITLHYFNLQTASFTLSNNFIFRRYLFRHKMVLSLSKH